MRIFTIWAICSLFHLSQEYEEPECSSINVVFRVTGRGFTYALNKGYATYHNKKFNMSYSIGNISKTLVNTSYWIDSLQLINHIRNKTFKDFDVNTVPETKCLNISVIDKLATMQGRVVCRSIANRDLSQNCTIVAKMPWYFQLHIGRSRSGFLIAEVCNSTNNCTLPINALTTEFTNCSPQQPSLCESEESRFRDYLKNILADRLKNICSIVRFLINTQLNVYIKENVNLLPNIIYDTFWVNLTMPNDPVYNTTFVESGHRGDVHWYLTDEKYRIDPHKCFDLNTEADSSMTYLWISKNAVKALLKGLQIHGKIKYKITAENMGHTNGLNTTCQYGVCVGRLVPSLAEKYPNCYLDLDLYSLVTPDIEFNKDLLIVTGKIIMFAYVRDPNSGHHPDVGIASLIGEVSMRIKLSITNNTLHGKIDAIDPNLENVNSTMSDFNLQTVNFIIRSAVIVTIEPLLNKQGEKGVEIPIVHAHMYNSSVRLIQDAMIIGFDIAANPSGTD